MLKKIASFVFLSILVLGAFVVKVLLKTTTKAIKPVTKAIDNPISNSVIKETPETMDNSVLHTGIKSATKGIKNTTKKMIREIPTDFNSNETSKKEEKDKVKRY